MIIVHSSCYEGWPRGRLDTCRSRGTDVYPSLGVGMDTERSHLACIAPASCPWCISLSIRYVGSLLVVGVVNALGCALYSGAECEFLYPFSASDTWERLSSGQISVFMAVPTIYHKLTQHYESMDDETQRRVSERVRGLRLMVSGSAALPPSVMTRWHQITGHNLLER